MYKKILGFIIPTLLAVGGLTSINNQKYEEVKALSYETEINIGPGFFYDFDYASGNLEYQDSIFWGKYPFNSLGAFYRGESAESWTGTLVSRTWIQHTQYVYFLWSAQNNSDNVYLRFIYGPNNEQIILKNNAFVGNPMMLWYVKIPDDKFASLDKENGFDMHVELVDYSTSDYAFHNFGYLHVNQNEDEVSDAMRFYLNHLKAPIDEEEINYHKNILNHYYYNAHLSEVFLKTVDNVNEDFEDNNKFVNHWYIDYNYDNNKALNRNVDVVIGTDTKRNGSNMPFNKTGDGYFKGWYENSINQGYVASDEAIYRFISRPFILNETGLVSIKMAGRSASLHVIDANNHSDLAWIDVRSFSNEGDEYDIASSGFNTVTMVRHIINLEKYVGQKIQLAIADVFEDNWAAAYFDELITNYEEYPTFKIDVAEQYFDDTNIKYPFYFDKYVCSTHIDNDSNGVKYVLGKEEVTDIDDTSLYEAHQKVNEFYSIFRRLESSGFSFVYPTNGEIGNFVDNLSSLSEEARKIFDYSMDLGLNNSKPFASGIIKTASDQYIDIAKDLIKITFDPNGGTGTMNPDYYQYSSYGYNLPSCTFTPPEGKGFVGWSINDGEHVYDEHDTVTISSNSTIKAIWKDITEFKSCIIFDLNGGTGTINPVYDEYAIYSYTIPEFTFTPPEGKEFICWLSDGKYRYDAGDTIEAYYNHIILTAYYRDIGATPNIFTLVFGDGNGNMENVEVEEFAKYTLPECTFTAPEDKEFSEWRITIGGNTHFYKPGDVITVYGNFIITPYWVNIYHPDHIINFFSNGGSGVMISQTAKETKKYKLPECTFTAPEGKEFDCWLINDEKYNVGDEVVITGDLSVYASWKDIVMHQVSFNSNGGTGSMENIEIKEGLEFVLPSCDFIAPEGQEFAGWLINETTYQVGDKVVINSDIEIKATWKDIPPTIYIISFNSNGGTGTMNDVEVEENEEFILPTCSFAAPEGKEFDAWMIDEQSYQPGEKLTVVSNLELKATWKDIPVITYTVSFSSNGGSGVMSSIEINEGEEFTLPTCGYTAPEGKEFDSWLINGEKYQVGDKIGITSDTLIEASWKDLPKPEPTPSKTSSGCGGSVTVTSVTLSLISLIGVALIISKKRK